MTDAPETLRNGKGGRGTAAAAGALAGACIGMAVGLSAKVEVGPSAEARICAMMAGFNAESARRELGVVRSALAGDRQAQRQAGEWEGRLAAELMAGDPREWMVNDLAHFANDGLTSVAQWGGRVERHIGTAEELLDRAAKGCPK